MSKTVISEDGRFEWGEEKDEINKKKHGFRFAEILEVFDDPVFFERYDSKNSTLEEDRYIGIGVIEDLVLLCCYTQRCHRTRIFSVRETEPIEEKEYYDKIKEAYTGTYRRN